MSIRIQSFLPRSRSKAVFVIVMASYCIATSYFIAAWRRAAQVESPPAAFYSLAKEKPLEYVVEVLLLAPLIESLILVGAFELVRRINAPVGLQVFSAAMFVSELHVWPWWPHGIIVLPVFLIQAGSYLYWRRASWKQAFSVVACIHALGNLIPAASALGYALRKT